jgi:hypothetical protein
VIDPDLKAAILEYATELRMRRGVPRDVERRLHAGLVQLRDELGESDVVDRELATLLVELVVTSSAAVGEYPPGERADVDESAALVGEAVMAVLTPDEMPPLPEVGG